MKVDPWQTIFLEALRNTGMVNRSCEIAGIVKQTAYRHRHEDESFAAQWDKALEDSAWSLVDEGMRRAREGVDEPIVANGQIIGIQKKYSDTLLIFLLKHIQPERFGDQLTIRLAPEQTALLARLGLTPADAWKLFMENLTSEYTGSEITAGD